MGDMQISSEYVAYAIHMISQLAGGAQTAIITHSQGGPDTQWALRFWPSTRNITRAFIALSPDFYGIDILGHKASDFCVGDLCQASLWQQSTGSHYYAALQDDTFQQLVPTTTIWSQNDGVVNPPEENAQLPSAAVISVQNLCPLRITTHLSMPVDSAGWALALDALNHGGKASVSRARSQSWSTCLRITAPNMNASVAKSLVDLWDSLVDGLLYVLDAHAISSSTTNRKIGSGRHVLAKNRQWTRTRCRPHQAKILKPATLR